VTRERRSLHERIRERQRNDFTARQVQAIYYYYPENLVLPVDDEQRRSLFNVHGNADAGTTFFTRQLQKTTPKSKVQRVYINETTEDVASAISAGAGREFSHSDVRLGDFEKRATEYQQRRRELESDPHAPGSIATFFTKTTAMIGRSEISGYRLIWTVT
jgi:hypothetical protein